MVVGAQGEGVLPQIGVSDGAFMRRAGCWRMWDQHVNT